ncbi:MAG: DegT/DnrJ/EryC1/StrS aminotransferase family protein [Spirochaetes bacterium]|nr:DegT/DnrJ/EryC1/StrS aminotransferase family protein [Spirochaetota bacterium]
MIPVNKPTIVRKDLEYVLNCLITERLEEGELAREFEKSIAHFIGVKYSLATNSYTSALHLALLSLGLRSGDEIICSAYSSVPLLHACRYMNVKPVPVDINMDTYNMDPRDVEKKVSNKIKAIVVDHNFGIPADIDQFLALNIPLIEDCSYALGAEYRSTIQKETLKTGSFGVVSVFSFDTDTLITTGNGGMLLSNTRDLISKAKENKYNPFMEKSDQDIQYDYRMADISAALGLSQLKIFKKLVSRRAEIADYYKERLRRSKYRVYQENENSTNVYSKYVLSLEGSLEKTISFLRKNKIDSKRPVDNPLFLHLGDDSSKYPNASHCYNKLIEIPVYPSLRKRDIEQIANTLLKVL